RCISIRRHVQIHTLLPQYLTIRPAPNEIHTPCLRDALPISDPAARVVRAADYATLVQSQALLDEARAQADAIVASAQEAFEAERSEEHTSELQSREKLV